MARRGPIVEKWSLKALKKPTRIRNNGTIQLQFFHRCIVGATGSKFVNGLPCFSRITFRLTKSIRIVRCFRSLNVIIVSFIFATFCTLPSPRGSFDAIAFLLAASRSRIPFFNSVGHL